MPWLLALAFVIRVLFALKLGDRQHQIDEGAYFNAALALAARGDLGSANVIPPVPVAFDALFIKLFGTSMLWPRLGQALAGTFTAWAVGGAAKDLTGSEKAGRLALVLACVYPFFIYYGGMLMTETLYLALAVPGLWQLCAALRSGSTRRAAAAGLLLGLAALCRAEGAFIMGPIWLVAAGLCAARRWNWRAWALGVLFWLIPITAWCARNHRAFGRFALDIHGGMTLLHGTAFYELNEIDTGVAQRAFYETAAYRQSVNLTEAQRDKVYMREAFRFMRESPGRTARQWAAKFVSFWRFWPRTDKKYQEDEVSRPSAGLPRWALVAISVLFEPALILGGLYGLWLLRGRVPELLPLHLWLLGTMGIHVLSVSQMRYRLPVMPVLIIAFAHAVVNRRSGTSR